MAEIIDDTPVNRGGEFRDDDDRRPFIFTVDWPVDGQWHTVSDEITTQTGITNYRVKFESGDLVGTQSIDFITDRTYEYTFTDDDEETYEIKSSPDVEVQHTRRTTTKESKIVRIYGH